ncbi:hypothetical protein MN608_00536 [Microdochium nivale]|nr:hypothetical protein MN608_00536 [Microdochium nivale]
MPPSVIMARPGHYLPLRDMIIDNCALFKGVSPDHIMIVTEKCLSGELIACALVRGDPPGRIVCSDLSGNLESALASLHDKSMRTVHKYRNTDGVPSSGPKQGTTVLSQPSPDQDCEFYLESETSSATASEADMSEWESESESDEGIPAVFTPVASPTLEDEAGEQSRPQRIASVVTPMPSSRAPYVCIKPQPTRSLSTQTSLGLPGESTASRRQCVEIPPLPVPVARKSAARSITLQHSPTRPPIVSKSCGSAVRTAVARGPPSWSIACDGGKPQRSGHLQPDSPGAAHFGQGTLAAEAVVVPPQKLSSTAASANSGQQRQHEKQKSQRPGDFIVPPHDAGTFDVVIHVNWAGKGEQSFLARSAASLTMLRVAVLKFCADNSGVFDSPRGSRLHAAQGQLQQHHASDAQNVGSPAGSGHATSPAHKKKNNNNNGAKTPAPFFTGLSHSSLPWHGVVLGTSIRSIGSGGDPTGTTYNMAAYSGDDVKALFRMLAGQGSGILSVVADVGVLRRHRTAAAPNSTAVA